MKKSNLTLSEIWEGFRKTVAIGGGPDAIRTVFGQFMEDGRNRMVAGDGYFQLVQFTKDGPTIESASPFGASSFPDSPHYRDQMSPFGKEQMKTMSLDKETVYKNSKRVYHPE